MPATRGTMASLFVSDTAKLEYSVLVQTQATGGRMVVQ